MFGGASNFSGLDHYFLATLALKSRYTPEKKLRKHPLPGVLSCLHVNIDYMEQEPPQDSHESEESVELTREELVARLRGVLGPDHINYLLESIEHGDDLQDMTGYAYGALLDQGEDPDEIFAELGITQPRSSEE